MRIVLFTYNFEAGLELLLVLSSNKRKHSGEILEDWEGKSGADEVLVTGTIYYTDDKRDIASEGKFYLQSRRQYNIPSGTSHTIADVKGKGHYIGTVLMAQGLEDGNTGFFEGDDRATIDGKLKLHGTGSEDYFNGGWYAIMDRWDRGISLPIHGSLDYDLMRSRTGGYRFYLSDKLNFNQSFQLTIEHQPEAKNNVKAVPTKIPAPSASGNVRHESRNGFRRRMTCQQLVERSLPPARSKSLMTSRQLPFEKNRLIRPCASSVCSLKGLNDLQDKRHVAKSPGNTRVNTTRRSTLRSQSHSISFSSFEMETGKTVGKIVVVLEQGLS
ncbi:MAG TPA: DUF2961 domain-containing protein [Chryseolinea sp.]|nr:DUF2961 domain-containing protein [Chryseolinea sp.]